MDVLDNYFNLTKDNKNFTVMEYVLSQFQVSWLSYCREMNVNQFDLINIGMLWTKDSSNASYAPFEENGLKHDETPE